MSQYYVVEIRKFFSGEYEHNVFWLYDADDEAARQKAEAKFHDLLSAAAVSNTASHACIMFSSEGFPLRNECYYHTPITE